MKVKPKKCYVSRNPNDKRMNFKNFSNHGGWFLPQNCIFKHFTRMNSKPLEPHGEQTLHLNSVWNISLRVVSQLNMGGVRIGQSNIDLKIENFFSDFHLFLFQSFGEKSDFWFGPIRHTPLFFLSYASAGQCNNARLKEHVLTC